MASAANKPEKPRFGIGEWYGNLFYRLTPEDRIKLNEARKGGKATRPPCPFKKSNPDGSMQECTKKGGVCSLKLYAKGDMVDGIPAGIPVEGDGSSLRVICPYRFHQDGVIFREIGQMLLDTDAPVVVGEVGFLMPEAKAEATAEEGESDEEIEEDGSEREDVGRIDSVLFRTDPVDWCAVELQAVYFSGSEMGAEFDLASKFQGEGAPFPAKKRRPDYRSSGPKRLMPQLQIKVPTLRRWGKRMAVVVDEAFFSALGRMDHVKHRSNSDIAWLIVRLDEGTSARATLVPPEKGRFTTLERAVEGLTAGRPVTLPEFEKRMTDKIEKERKAVAKALRKAEIAKQQPGDQANQMNPG